MFNRLYKLLIKPHQTDRELRNRELVLNVLLAGTLTLLLLILLVLVVAYSVDGREYLTARIATCATAALVLFVPYHLSRRGNFRVAAISLVAIYGLIATAISYYWGVVNPTALLLFGLVIVLSGTLLGPAYPIYFAAGATVLLTTLQILAEAGAINTDWSWLSHKPDMADVAASGIIFGGLAMVSWLFNHQMARSLRLAIQAEGALTRQKDLLEIKVKERTRELQAAQMEKIQQMYKFAELGQLSTAMMHDLTNHLTCLTLNIEGLRSEPRSQFLADAQRSIRHIDEMVARVRDQLNGRTSIRNFDVINEISETVKILRHKAQLADIQLTWNPPKNSELIECTGDTVRFRQMLSNLIANGLDAYEKLPRQSGQRREVLVAIAIHKKNIILSIDDWGVGIPPNKHNMPFQPFLSTKETGMGMGLFIVKQIVEDHFKGEVFIDKAKKHTSFVAKLPRATV